MSKNSICHIEIAAIDVKNCGEFYKNLFGWKLNFEMGEEYVMFQPEDGPGGGFMKSEKPISTGGMIFYVWVDDIEAYLKKAADLGGKQVVPKTEIPNVGWFGHFADPDGNLIGLYTGKSDQA